MMSRYQVPAGVEAEFEPGSRRKVLRNLLGIRSRAEMNHAEDEALQAVQDRYLEQGPVSPGTMFSTVLLRQMHRDWLGSTYAWAGMYRTVDMAKGGFVFPPAYLISENMARFERVVLSSHTPCRPQPLSGVCRSMALVHADLLLIHPFREGNGRLARWASDLMAAQAQLPLPDYGFSGKGSRGKKAQYLAAVFEGYRGNHEPLARFFGGGLESRMIL